jgi:leucyl/phenylalanyl-tRNA--protein transferase
MPKGGWGDLRKKKIKIGNNLFEFPNPESALTEPNGLLAMGGDLSPQTLLSAYTQGIFPWYSQGEPIMWWSPDPRLILYFSDFKISKSFQKTLNKNNYSVTCDHDFEQVIHHCAQIPSRLNHTWITKEMIEAYVDLHKLGIAHSIEVWAAEPNKSTLIGGLYGLSIGQAFFGESMFSLEKDCSKIALYYLTQFLSQQNFTWLDCQVPSEHLMTLGAKIMPRREFLDLLKQTLTLPTPNSTWHRIIFD